MSASPEHSSKAQGAGDAATLPDLQIRRFASYLREHGFLIGLGELDAMLRITLLLKPSQYSQLKSCWRGLVCSTPDQWQKYPDFFEAFWFPHRLRGSTKSSGIKRKNKSLQSLVAQDYPGLLHVIVINDGSNMQTRLILDELGRHNLRYYEWVYQLHYHYHKWHLPKYVVNLTSDQLRV